MKNSNVKLFSGTANQPLAEKIAIAQGGSLGNVKIERFPDGEIFVQYTENIRNADVFIIQPTCGNPNEMLMELLIMLDAARRASAQRITAVLPYFGYARQDRKHAPRVPITAKLVANLLVTAGADRVLTMDLHAQQIQGFFDIPLDHLYASPVLVKYFHEIVGEEAVVVSPDTGSVKLAHAYGDMLGGGRIAIVAKRRISGDRVESTHLVGDVKGRNCVIVDDLTTTAGTLIAAAEKLKEGGAKKIYASVTHCCLTQDGIRALEASPILELVTTDTVLPRPECRSEKVRILSVARLLGEAIRRIHVGHSVSSLLRFETDKEEEVL